MAVLLSASESSVSNPATASHRVRNLSFHGLITYLLLPKYTRYTHIYTHRQAVQFSACATYPPLFPHPPHPPLFNILAQYRWVALGLHVQVGPLDCSPGLLGREEVVEKGGEQKKRRWWKERPTITVCFLACRGLQPNLLHLLWRLTLYVGEGVVGCKGGPGWWSSVAPVSWPRASWVEARPGRNSMHFVSILSHSQRTWRPL